MSELESVHGRVVCYVDLESKNWHTFTSGLKIRRERKYENLNRRETEPVNATVVHADHIPEGAEILINHNSLHPSNQIFNYKDNSGADTSSTIRYFAIPTDECYLWRKGTEEWRPAYGFATALRLFKPYTGFLQGIPPTEIKERLYITSGEFKDQVVITLKACDYEIIYQGSNGREARIIRLRHFEDVECHVREEIIAIDHETTEKIRTGEFLIGLSPSDAKKCENVSDGNSFP